MEQHATFTLQREDGALLVEFRTWCHDWVLPGGAVEPGEDPEYAAIRECLEELGVRAVEIEGIDIPDCFTYHGAKIYPYVITKWIGEIPDVDFDNAAPLGWLSIDEMLEHSVESNRLVACALAAHRDAGFALRSA